MRTKGFLSLATALLALSITAPAPAQPLGESHVVAPVPSPGFPEGIAVRGNRFYVSGPANFGQPLGSAYVNAYDIRSGALEATYPITITNPFAGAVFTAPASFLLEASASDPDGSVTNVQFFRDATSLGSDTSSPYSVSVSGLVAGDYTLSAVASDNRGLRATVSQTGTQRFFVARLTLFDKCYSDKMRSRFDWYAVFQRRCASAASASATRRGRPQRYQLHALTIERDFNLIRVARRAYQIELQVVVGVEREVSL